MNNILLICFGKISEVLSVTPAISVLKRNFPFAKITVLTNKEDILKNNSAVKEIIKPQSFTANLKNIKAQKYDMAIIFKPSFKYSLITALAGISKRISITNFYNKFLMTNPVPPASDIYKQNTDLLSPLFIYSFPAKPILYVSKKENEWAKKYLSDIGILPSDKFVCINPASPKQHLNWPKEKYAALIDNIGMKYPTVKILLTATTKKEMSASNEIYWRSIRKPFILRETLPLNNFISILSRASIVISNYSAPSHISAALGKPTISFYPALEGNSLLKPYPGTAYIMEPSRPKCKECKDNFCVQYCLSDISLSQTEAVFDKIITDILKERKGVFNESGTFSFFDN